MSYEISDKNSCSDIGLNIAADTLEQLFIDSALGLTEITADWENLEESISVEINLAEKTIEQLYYSWLSELVYIKDADLFLPRKMDLEIKEDNQFSLRARLYGDRMDRRRHNLKRDIKAVTFYNFRVEQIHGQWKAEVVFDL